ncbi:MAG: ATP-dependent DNA helicase RecG [Oscillospiraceae bacterium]|nr:ATP-dependent DNA helicase RecG [Oscillospiraceae bacterium]
MNLNHSKTSVLLENIKILNGVSDKRATLYKKLGIETIGELISHYPKDYVDLTTSIPISEACERTGEFCVIHATVVKKMPPYFGARVPVYKLSLTDDSGAINCTFFNNEYSFNKLVIGRDYIFYGKISVPQNSLYQSEILSPLFIMPDEPNKLTPKYRLTAGLSQNIVWSHIYSAFGMLESSSDISANNGDNKSINILTDLPADIRERCSLLDSFSAMRMLHFPKTSDECQKAKRSLVFRELLTLQLGLSFIRSRNRKLTGAKAEKVTDFDFRESEFCKTLPFTPTNAQFEAVKDCVRDMKKSVPMNRLLQGDVGSGKTLVAAAVAYYVFLNGFQTAIMVPTEILAKQHYETMCDFLEPHGIKIELVVGGQKAVEKRECRKAIKNGEAIVVVGTHALIQKSVEFNSLGLVITDEQHRFGVTQRSELISKGANPHTLVMSATPIPRTLGLIIYGDLDISLLNEMPKGRLPIKTYGVDTSYRKRLYTFIAKEVAKGRQAYVVCPLIEENENGDSTQPSKASVVKYYENLRDLWFEKIPTGLLHGRMKQEEKSSVMAKFKSGEIKVLVSTTVIEVGVDVPNATVMLIENAEQFGLSQLHQLRGRVGRGEHQSHCILVSDSKSPYTKARIDTMVSTNNGFEIAGKDLELRGPGDFFGQKQHGLPLLKVGDLVSDTEILEETQILAGEISKSDPEFQKHPELRQLVDALFKNSDEYGFN